MKRVVFAVVALVLVAPPSVRLHSHSATGVEVGWISRDPSIAAPARTDGPVTDGWPEAGRAVHWVAHVINRGGDPVAISYRWLLDGAVVDSGITQVPAGESEIAWPWRWEFARREITFEIAAASEIDSNTADNIVRIFSDALSVALFVERSTYDWMLEDGRSGFEQMFQREIARWNSVLERAIFPTTPGGVLDRMRLDRVIVFDDGARPRNADYLNTDFHWTFTNSESDGRFLHKDASAGVVANQTIVFHELLHQRGLVDLYSYDVKHSRGGADAVNIVDNGMAVAGTFLMPWVAQGALGLTVYHSLLNGLMGSDYSTTTSLTEFCANGLNLWAGRRTPLVLDRGGNLIDNLSTAPAAPNYVRLVPAVTELAIVDHNGAPVPGASVSVYADHNAALYAKTYAATPDRIFTSDASGIASLPGDVFEGLPPASGLPKSQVLIIGVKTSRARGYAFIPVYDLNLLYFRSGPDRGRITLPVTLHPL